MRYQVKNKLVKSHLGGKGLKLFNYILDTETGEIIEGLTKACEKLNQLETEKKDAQAKYSEIEKAVMGMPGGLQKKTGEK